MIASLFHILYFASRYASWLLVQWKKMNFLPAVYYCTHTWGHLRKSHTTICISVTSVAKICCLQLFIFSSIQFQVHFVKRGFPLQSQVSLPLFEAAETDAARAKVEHVCTNFTCKYVDYEGCWVQFYKDNNKPLWTRLIMPIPLHAYAWLLFANDKN